MLTSRIWNPLTMAQEFFSPVLDTFETSFGDEHTTKKTPSNHCKYWSSRKRRHNLMNGRNVCVVLVVVLIRVTDVWWSKSSHFQYQTSEAERSPFRQTCSFSADVDTGLVTLCSFRCVCVMFFFIDFVWNVSWPFLGQINNVIYDYDPYKIYHPHWFFNSVH